MSVYFKQPKKKPQEVTDEIRTTVSEIISDVSRRGTDAVRHYSEKFDKWSPPTFRVPDSEVASAAERVDPDVLEHAQFTLDQVRNFARLQRESMVEFQVETLPGVILGQKHIPVNSVGAYSPGGLYPLIASAIMTVATAKTAGVPRVASAAPPRDALGMHPPQLWAMAQSGADEIFCVGGVQALAGLAFGIEDSEPVDMIVGAGNAYVAEAKRQLFGTVGIDLLAGPTEIMIIADESANPSVVAADLLGQAEHGPTSPAILVTTSESIAQETQREVEHWLESWPTAPIAAKAWEDYGTILLCDSDEEMLRVSDEIAPEHLEVHTENPEWFAERLRNYGTLFVGTHATVTYSDKAIGTNHVLPTERAARYTGGLWVGKFLKTVTTQRVTATGSALVAEHAAAVADAELMYGHAISARLRRNPEYFWDAFDTGSEEV
jgi:sulfopropanediol 3-dehydrogenase